MILESRSHTPNVGSRCLIETKLAANSVFHTKKWKKWNLLTLHWDERRHLPVNRAPTFSPTFDNNRSSSSHMHQYQTNLFKLKGEKKIANAIMRLTIKSNPRANERTNGRTVGCAVRILCNRMQHIVRAM